MGDHKNQDGISKQGGPWEPQDLGGSAGAQGHWDYENQGNYRNKEDQGNKQTMVDHEKQENRPVQVICDVIAGAWGKKF